VVQIRAFEVLGSVEWQLLTDVSGQPIGFTFMSQAVDPYSRSTVTILADVIRSGYFPADTQTNKPANKQTNKQTSQQTNKQTNKQPANKETNKQTNNLHAAVSSCRRCVFIS